VPADGIPNFQLRKTTAKIYLRFSFVEPPSTGNPTIKKAGKFRRL
jgi:hypothetical protein